jgi:hypothetical protein
MLIRVAVLQRIKTGDISVVFRRWRRPTVKTGGTLQTAVGLLNIVAVEDVVETDITQTDVGRAGYDTKAALLRELGSRGDRLSRVTLAFGGADPRIALRDTDALSGTELDALATRLQRLDTRSAAGPWTARVLGIIEQHPDVAARILAQHRSGEKDWLKPNVRKLKTLGLTISHDPGYVLSARGRAVLDHVRNAEPGDTALQEASNE